MSAALFCKQALSGGQVMSAAEIFEADDRIDERQLVFASLNALRKCGEIEIVNPGEKPQRYRLTEAGIEAAKSLPDTPEAIPVAATQAGPSQPADATPAADASAAGADISERHKDEIQEMADSPATAMRRITKDPDDADQDEGWQEHANLLEMEASQEVRIGDHGVINRLADSVSKSEKALHAYINTVNDPVLKALLENCDAAQEALDYYEGAHHDHA